MRRCATAVGLCFLVLAGLAVAEGGADSDLILILDASNSMWGQIDGVNKIVIAREAVGDLLDGLPDGAPVGLVAYGHRREGDCEDIEVLSAIEPLDRSALKETVNAINPKGKTPITSSIKAALELARDRESSAIVLISDGLETCGLDPCAAVRIAREEGVPFVLHVVGFDVAKEDTAQLECAAQEGGGQYLQVENAPQLADALRAAYEKPTSPEGRLAVEATAEGDLQDALITVTDATTGAHVAGGRTYRSGETNPRRIPLADGRYVGEIKAIGIKGSPTFKFEFEISGGSRVEKSFDYSSGELSVKVTRNGELSDAVVSVRAHGERKNVAGGRTYRSSDHNPKTLPISAGTYDVSLKSVEVKNGPEPVFEEVVVLGGERTELAYEYTSGVIRIGTRRGDTLVDSVVSIIDQAGKNVAGGRTYASESSNPMEVVLVPGTYTLRIAEIRGDKRELSAIVVAGEAAEVLVDLDRP